MSGRMCITLVAIAPALLGLCAGGAWALPPRARHASSTRRHSAAASARVETKEAWPLAPLLSEAAGDSLRSAAMCWYTSLASSCLTAYSSSIGPPPPACFLSAVSVCTRSAWISPIAARSRFACLRPSSKPMHWRSGLARAASSCSAAGVASPAAVATSSRPKMRRTSRVPTGRRYLSCRLSSESMSHSCSSVIACGATRSRQSAVPTSASSSRECSCL